MQSRFCLHIRFNASSCPADLIPDQIQNLKVELDSNVPFVTLTWQPPQNVGAGSQSCRSDVSSYHICFKPQGREYYDEMRVDSSTTRIILKRDSGLIPHTTSIFKVRAQCGDDLGEWTAVSTFIGECTENILAGSFSFFSFTIVFDITYV